MPPFSKSSPFSGLAHRRRVLDAALVPKGVEAAGDLQRAACADIAVEDFAVVTDTFDDVVGPVIGQAEVSADGGTLLGAEEALDIRIWRALHLIDVLLRDAEFLGIDHRIGRPADDVEPLVVALADGRAERLLGDDLRQNDVVVRVLQRQAQRVEAGLVGGVDVATAGIVRGVDFLELVEDHRIVLEIVGLEIVGEVEFGRRAGLHADGCAGKFERRFDVQFLANHEALAVIIGDRTELEAERGVAIDRPSGVTGKHIDFAGLQCSKAVLGAQRGVFHFGRIAEYGGGYGAAKVDVETGPVAGGVRLRKAEKACIDAALYEALGLYIAERRGGSAGRGVSQCCDSENCGESKLFHLSQPSSIVLWLKCIASEAGSSGTMFPHSLEASGPITVSNGFVVKRLPPLLPIYSEISPC
ncbi:hypothetical protein RHSP_13702 [Rhizobium freirei PRF 81]|uniref:Uncharacterized protein n=1 Tax=Rhizobium freirei PRF 81 TaxID=363754 RepID=N6U9W7_9HYPH|nr:hypothetical protein RHSP_13702 [Rhizobium freirei PRF 81]